MTIRSLQVQFAMPTFLGDGREDWERSFPRNTGTPSRTCGWKNSFRLHELRRRSRRSPCNPTGSWNYSAQDAEHDFLGKQLPFRIHLEICYIPDAPPDAVKIKLIQNRKEIVPTATERARFYPPTDPYTRLPSIGETIDIEVDALKLDGSTLEISIETPDGRSTPVEFDLLSLR